MSAGGGAFLWVELNTHIHKQHMQLYVSATFLFLVRTKSSYIVNC